MILGMHLIGHDPGFAVIDKGRIVSVLELERINGDRFGLNWPLSSGKKENIKKNVELYIDKTLFFWNKYAEDIDKIALPGLYKSSKLYNKIHEMYARQFMDSLKNRFKSNISPDIFRTKHHISHAALACFTSPFMSSVIVSIDGQGDDGYFNIYQHDNNTITRIARYSLQMGRAYQANAKIINDQFGHIEAVSGKLMGLSAYGEYKESYYKKAKKFIIKFSKNKKFRRSYTRLRKKINTRFKGVNDKQAQNWMKSFQTVWTDIILDIIKKHVSKDDNLCLTGGCALNGITNYEIYQKITKNIYVPPNPSDCGVACGAALYYYYFIEKNKYQPITFQDPFVGAEILDESKITKYFSRKDYLGQTTVLELCKILRQKKIIGVIDGKSEIGPRALGNRSIVCDCSLPEMRDIINKKVKFREWYRPFAPIVRKEDATKYFCFDGDSYYMSYVVPVKPEFRSKIPSVCHVDGTARLQTVTKKSNSFLYDLLTKYEQEFGIGVLLNTSFNIKGKAILSQLSDAFHVLDNTELDGLYCSGNLWLKPNT